MIQIRKEADEIISGKQPKDNNLLKNAPHPIHVLTMSDAEWNRYVSGAVDATTKLTGFADRTLVNKLLTLFLGCVSASSGPRFPVSTMVSDQSQCCCSTAKSQSLVAFGDLNLIVSLLLFVSLLSY